MRAHTAYATAALGATAVLASLATPALAAPAEPADPGPMATHDYLWGKAYLDGRQEVPGPGDRNGRGWFEYHIKGHTFCYRERVTKIAKPTASHIHRGVRGEAGPIVVTLKTPKANNRWIEDCITAKRDQNRHNAAKVLTRWELRGIKRDPGLFYTNVHNKKFPKGAIRGQLRPWNAKADAEN